jgi:hypothetical protein
MSSIPFGYLKRHDIREHTKFYRDRFSCSKVDGGCTDTDDADDINLLYESILCVLQHRFRYALRSIDPPRSENDGRCCSKGEGVAMGSTEDVEVKAKHFNSWHVPVALLPGKEFGI